MPGQRCQLVAKVRRPRRGAQADNGDRRRSARWPRDVHGRLLAVASIAAAARAAAPRTSHRDQSGCRWAARSISSGQASARRPRRRDDGEPGSVDGERGLELLGERPLLRDDHRRRVGGSDVRDRVLSRPPDDDAGRREVVPRIGRPRVIGCGAEDAPPTPRRGHRVSDGRRRYRASAAAAQQHDVAVRCRCSARGGRSRPSKRLMPPVKTVFSFTVAR